MDLVFATANKHKLIEAQAIIGAGYQLITPVSFGINEEIEETGITLHENALIKASYIWERTNKPCFADDTGLEIDALGGRPGVYSARYAGENCSFSDNVNKVLKELEGVLERVARFKTVIAYINKGKIYYFEGSVEGQIIEEPKGDKGFGYDPVFLPVGSELTMAQMSEKEKNKISHRGVAMRKFAEFLNQIDI